MARRKLTAREQLRGVRAAIRSKRTPPQLKAGLRKRAAQLQAMIRADAKSRKTLWAFAPFKPRKLR